MSTLIRPEISKKNDMWISKHRYYELKHFCLQYPEWKRKVVEQTYAKGNSVVKVNDASQVEFHDPVFSVVERTEHYLHNINIVEEACEAADSEIKLYLLEALTEGVTYEYLRMIRKIPCGRTRFYKAYRLTFWVLDKLKGA